MHFSFSQIVVIEKKQHQKGKRSQNIWRHSLSCALEVWDSRNKKLPVSVCPCKLYLAPHIADIWAIIRSCTFPHCLLSCSSCLPSCAFCYLAMPLLSMCIFSFVLENKRSLIINHSPTKKESKLTIFLKNMCTTIPRDFKVTLLNVNFVLRFLEFKVLPQQPGTKWSLFDFQCWAVKRHIWYKCDIFKISHTVSN